jgi:hypothetical protein
VVLAAVSITAAAKNTHWAREGAAENAAAECTALLTDLIEHGLNPERAILVVIDGAKRIPALRIAGALGRNFRGRANESRCEPRACHVRV